MSRGVRHLEREDIPRVAELFMRILKNNGPLTDDLIAYFEKVYFTGPWLEDDLRSLVYHDAGDITGFIGMIPRRLTLKGQQIRAAVVGNFLFDHDTRSRKGTFGAVDIIRELIAGPQDLIISETANDKSRGIWHMCGGVTSHLYSMRWVYMTRPMSYAVQRWSKVSASKALSLGAALVAKPADFAFGMSRGKCRAYEQGYTTSDLSAADIVAGLPTLSQYKLKPHYQEADLSWLLAVAAENKAQGDLRARVVKKPDGNTLGWFVYFRNPSGPSEVLQIGAPERALGTVFECLLDDAVQSSTPALTGALCPTMAQYLTKRYAISFLGSWALMHARDRDIIHAFDRGTAMFTGLESEQWLRFIGDFENQTAAAA